MKYQKTFKRHEIKYMISSEQRDIILEAISPYMRLDEYGLTTIRNIYFDTDDFQLIRHSIEKPIYKEKLRLRSYSLVTPEDNIFIELKKKYKGVVYKRRITLREGEAMEAFLSGNPLPVKSQIGDEIEYFRQFYAPLSPKMFLSYEREAYFMLDGSDFRITFDKNILYRTDKLSLTRPPDGALILGEDKYLMEIKTSGAIPLWLTRVLSENKIFKTSFSKYGVSYTDMINKQNRRY